LYTEKVSDVTTNYIVAYVHVNVRLCKKNERVFRSAAHKSKRSRKPVKVKYGN